MKTRASRSASALCQVPSDMYFWEVRTLKIAHVRSPDNSKGTVKYEKKRFSIYVYEDKDRNPPQLPVPIALRTNYVQKIRTPKRQRYA
jgi:hypothetical protein